MKDKILKIIIILILIILLTSNFYANILDKDNTSFVNFQQKSEFLVTAKLFADKNNMSDSTFGLYTAYITEDGKNLHQIYDKLNNYDSLKEKVKLVEYRSQIGLQGYVFSILYNKLHIKYGILQLICCLILAIILVAICYLLYRKYNKLMAVIFYITFLLSPWIVNFARNLYWVEFTWFLPTLLGLILSMNYSRKKLIVPCIFASIFIKCLCGYEYITTIMMSTISFFIIDLFIEKDKVKRKEIFNTIIIVGITCLLAFCLVLCIHAIPRGNGNILAGLKNIYEEDVLRRTVIPTDASKFADVYTDSLNAGIVVTILKYFSWSTNIIFGIDGKYFNIIFVTTIAILIYNYMKKEKNTSRDILMFVIFFLTTVSWYALGKAHSYIHTHMNYVLWYFGFIQICLYIIVNFILKICSNYRKNN